jgi:hypothetical protein
VLVLDDFAMRELTPTQADDLYELINERAGRSLILTSDRSPVDWYPLFPNPVVAKSLLDRLINNSHQLLMAGLRDWTTWSRAGWTGRSGSGWRWATTRRWPGASLGLYRDAVQPAMAQLGADLPAAAARPGLGRAGDRGSQRRHGRDAAPGSRAGGARVVVLDGLGHWWMVQDPKRAAAVLEEFWSSLSN